MWAAAEEEGRKFTEIERIGIAKVALAIGLFVGFFAFVSGYLLNRLVLTTGIL
jgi:hypothetical protein